MEVRFSVDNDQLSALVTEKYAKRKHFDYFFEEWQRALTYSTKNENLTYVPIGLYENGKLVAHSALMIDTRLPKGEAFFGFFETSENEAVFAQLWEELITAARKKNITTVKGPIQGSIWHQYRALKDSDGSPDFISEPISEPYYHDFLLAKNPAAEITYCSGYRERFGTILRLLGAAASARASLSGFSIQRRKEVTLEDLQKIAHISREIFSKSWGYTELTEKEFFELYAAGKLSSRIHALYLLYRGSNLIGFLSTGTEDEKTLIIKTAGILPEYQGKGLGNALAHAVHEDATKEGFTKIIYALVRDGNKVQYFPKDDLVIFRKYSAFTFAL